MVTLYWPGFPALVNWLMRRAGRTENEPAPPAPETAMERRDRWAEEAASIPRAPVRWGNFR